jgi:two-component system nitrate/nitrite sensor histidine kinase NarX
LKWLTIALPTLLIGGFEYARHDLFEQYLSMQTGNLYITLLTLLLSYLFASWVFRSFERINRRLAEEQTKRAIYEERERLARELHDHIAQTLFFTGVMLKQGKIEEARSAVSDIDQQLRQAIFNLRVPPDKSAGFAARLSGWLEEWSELSGIRVRTQVELPDGALAQAEELQLFAIVQEAFANIRKHSQAYHAELTLRAGQDCWTLVVADDGIGLGVATNANNAAGGRGDGRCAQQRYGLELIARRARELGAAYELTSATADGSGTKLTVTRRGGAPK